MLRALSYRRPINMIIIANILAFGLLYIYKKPFDKLVLLEGLIVTGLICITYFVIIKRNMGDEYLFLVVAMLASLGVLMIYRLDQVLGFKQIVWFTVGIFLFFLSYHIYIKVKIWDKLIFYYIGVSFALYLITLIMGSNINGSTNWIMINGYSFQPSEIIKIMYIMTIACFLKNSEQIIFKNYKFGFCKNELKSKMFLMLTVYAFIGFLILQKEWGTSLLMFLMFFMVLYAFDDNVKLLLVNGAAAILAGLGGFMFVYHIKIRVNMWLDPWADAAGKGYQITQSLFAIGEGGFFGRGIGMGNPNLIPEVKNDFIFSAICEEMGIFGGVAVILLYFMLVYRGFKVTLYIRDKFKKSVALGY